MAHRTTIIMMGIIDKRSKNIIIEVESISRKRVYDDFKKASETLVSLIHKLKNKGAMILVFFSHLRLYHNVPTLVEKEVPSKSSSLLAYGSLHFALSYCPWWLTIRFGSY
mmetsp:Transcript_49414/g.55206  ORF Transcript_49414/g.55206 Transcript_49414/m.55206 type:complete len:110 (-) Transcript_49414:356-685(-)